MGLVNITVYSKSLHKLKCYYITKKLHTDVHYIYCIRLFVILIIFAHGRVCMCVYMFFVFFSILFLFIYLFIYYIYIYIFFPPPDACA